MNHKKKTIYLFKQKPYCHYYGLVLILHNSVMQNLDWQQ